MDFDQLRQLDAIDREGTISAAAERLHLSQPALSRSVQRLEAELGQPLFDRSGRRTRPHTPRSTCSSTRVPSPRPDRPSTSWPRCSDGTGPLCRP